MTLLKQWKNLFIVGIYQMYLYTNEYLSQQGTIVTMAGDIAMKYLEGTQNTFT